jgi:hypothetical protein
MQKGPLKRGPFLQCKWRSDGRVLSAPRREECTLLWLCSVINMKLVAVSPALSGLPPFSTGFRSELPVL